MKKKLKFKRTASYYGRSNTSDYDVNARQSHFFTIGRDRVRVVFDDDNKGTGHIATAPDPEPNTEPGYYGHTRVKWVIVFEGSVREVELEFSRRFGHKFSCVGRGAR